MFGEISKSVGNIDLLVNNAGDVRPGDFFNNKMWDYEFQNIFFPTLRVSQYFLKQNAGADLRKIINITSVYGLLESGNSEYFAYSVAKSALASMSVTLAKIDSKILVNAIAPGYTMTHLWEGISSQVKASLEARTMINRFIEPEEIAHIAVALLENDAITGQVITIDGGLSLQRLERK
jgi:3-oxoacyl-[acyl-carrier protein] reductase